MADPFSKRTFWEKLGRGVAQGWEKARDATSRLGELAGLKLDLKNARDHLESRYRLLGRLAADRFIEPAESGLDPSDPALNALLGEVRAARAALADLEKRLEECREPEGAERAGPDGEPGG
jgi:hypothetical protein